VKTLIATLGIEEAVVYKEFYLFASRVFLFCGFLAYFFKVCEEPVPMVKGCFRAAAPAAHVCWASERTTKAENSECSCSIKLNLRKELRSVEETRKLEDIRVHDVRN
jgi:hypothetical protein